MSPPTTERSPQGRHGCLLLSGRHLDSDKHPCRPRKVRCAGSMLVDNCSDLWIAIGQLAVPARRFWHGDTLGVRRPGWTVSWLGSGGDGDTNSGPVARTTISAHLPGCLRASGAAIDPRGAV